MQPPTAKASPLPPLRSAEREDARVWVRLPNPSGLARELPLTGEGLGGPLQEGQGWRSRLSEALAASDLHASVTIFSLVSMTELLVGVHGKASRHGSLSVEEMLIIRHVWACRREGSLSVEGNNLGVGLWVVAEAHFLCPATPSPSPSSSGAVKKKSSGERALSGICSDGGR
ncbi:hypothetical protein KSP39_PZI018750 [Platanthera zijinensis]|uniref:Uncharacterized protein n=1 Tax=Platanthera zijinensis TaxID=2320716 RepID=A0AAP0B4A7_9ASPA